MIWWILLLFLAGLILIIAEIFLPGMICGTIGAMLVVASCIVGAANYPGYVAFIVIGELIISLAAVIVGFKMFPKTPAGRAMILNHNQNADEGWVANESDTELIGHTGDVLTALRPAGTIEIGGRRIDAVSDGVFIDDGATVRVVEVQGNRVVVEKIEQADDSQEEKQAWI